MIRRVVLFILLIILTGIVAEKLQEFPPIFAIDGFGYQLETTPAVAIGGGLLLFLGGFLLLTLIIKIIDLPHNLRVANREKKLINGTQALSISLFALANGDLEKSEKHLKQTEKLLQENPLPALLKAQICLRKGQDAKAELHLQSLLDDKIGGLLAATTLSNLARKRKDLNLALVYAQKAHELDIHDANSIISLFDLLLLQKNWAKADELINQFHLFGKYLDAKTKKRLNAIYAYSQIKHNFSDADFALTSKAHKLAPNLIENTKFYVEMLLHLGKKSSAIKILQKSWKAAPHPELVDLLIIIGKDEPAEKLGKMAESLANLRAGHLESHLLLARIAIHNRAWKIARNSLSLALDLEAQSRIYSLVADIERAEKQDFQETARWLEKANQAIVNPVWHCQKCGHNLPKWELRCSVCDGFDSIIWGKQEKMGANSRQYLLA